MPSAVGQGRTEDVAAQGQAPLLVVRGDLGRRMKDEPLGLRTQGALADGAFVGVDLDEQGLALVGSACGRGAGGGGGQELGRQRVLLAHGLGTDDGHLTIARGGHGGDDFAALKKAQDALAGSDQLKGLAR